ncbi:MAG: transcription repressor NadR [Lachnospiraceae bacterium]|nr:transcription repressor NadR [Lachnospiraceae bacterium]
MTTNERRRKIFEQLKASKEAIPAKVFAADYKVSRQIIVGDMAVIRANHPEIISTNRGYVLGEKSTFTREFKVKHGPDRVKEELTLIVDHGGTVRNVSISHRAYGRISAEMSISSRQDVVEFVERLLDSKSTLLGSVTSGYHYHLVEASGEERLDLIEEKLGEAGFLVPLLPWEKYGEEAE